MRGLIIGAGVAGPVLGMFLRQIGIEARVCEQRETAQTQEGAFLGVGPNGMNVLAQLGLLPVIEAAGELCRGFHFLNGRGEHIGGIDGQHDRDDYGAQLVMIKRGALQGTLLAAARASGVEVTLGKKLVKIAQHAHEVVASFADGSEERADFLVGCDGLRSRTRALVFDDAPAPSFNGLIGLGGFAPLRGDEPLERGFNTMAFGKRAFFGAFVGQRDEVWWFHNAGQPSADGSASYGREQILEAHRDDATWIAELVARTPQIIGPWPQHDILSLPRWHQQRVCLIGDAAHAVSPSGGQGASLALEDTVVLARCLRELPEPQHAFAKFEALRRGRVEWAAAQSRRQGSGKSPSNAAALWLRDRMLPMFLKFGASAQRKAYGYRAELQ